MLRIAMFALAGGLAGFVAGATGASFVAAVLRMSRMEGGAGAFAVGIGLVSGVFGMVAALLAMLTRTACAAPRWYWELWAASRL